MCFIGTHIQNLCNRGEPQDGQTDSRQPSDNGCHRMATGRLGTMQTDLMATGRLGTRQTDVLEPCGNRTFRNQANGRFGTVQMHSDTHP